MAIATKGQRKEVLTYLQKGNFITNRIAYEKFDVIRLSAIIFDLRKAGYKNKKKKIDATKNDVKYFLV